VLVFIPVLAQAKRVGLREYGTLAQRYVRDFDEKWLRGGAPADEAFVGSADIQSLADLQQLRGRARHEISAHHQGSRLSLAVLTLLPLLPLLLTMLSFEELLGRLLKVVF